MRIASPQPNAADVIRRHRSVGSGCDLVIAEDLRRLTGLPANEAGLIRNALVMALLHPVRRGFAEPENGAVRIGQVPGAQKLLRLHGVRLLIPAVTGRLDPRWVTLVHRTPLGGVEVRAGVSFGGTELEASAMAHGMSPHVLRRIVNRARLAAGGPDQDWLTPLLLWTAGAG